MRAETQQVSFVADKGLIERLKRSAQKDNRSLSNEIATRLDRSLAADKR
jgi:hypothetical protein